MVFPSATSSPSRCSTPAVRAGLPAPFLAFSWRLTMLGPEDRLINLLTSLFVLYGRVCMALKYRKGCEHVFGGSQESADQ